MSRDLRLLTVALFFWGLGEGLFFYFVPLYLGDLGADAVQIGALLGIAAVLVAFTHIPAGALSDRFGPKVVLTAAWSVGLVGTWIMFLAPGLPVFVAGLVVYYLASFVMSPIASYVTAARGNWRLPRAITTVSAGFSSGSVLGPLLGGQLAESLGLRSAFGLGAVVFLASMGVVLFIRRQAVIPAEHLSRYDGLLRNQGLRRFLLFAFLTLFGLYLSWPLTPIFLQNVRAVSLAQFGVLGSLNAAGVALFNLTLGRLEARRGYLVAQAIVGLSVVALCFGVSPAWYALGYFLAGAFRTARFLITAQVQALVHPSEIGLAYGISETVASSVLVTAPPLAGILYGHQPAFPFYASLGLIPLFLIATVALGRRSELVIQKEVS